MAADFGKRLREERQRLGLSQADLGQLGGVTQPTQANYERGARCPDIEYLARVAACGVDLDFVISAVPAGAALSSDRALDLLEELVLLVESCSESRRVPLTKETKARVTRILFRQVVEWNEVKEERVCEVLDLVA